MRTIDLFSGCGEMTLEFQNAGFDIVAAFDNWQPAIDVYKENFQHPIFNTDLSHKEIYSFICDFNPDMIISSPPCQDFSSAGKRNETLGRADLSIAFTDIVTRIQPKWFVMENVDRITKSQTFKEICMISMKNCDL